MKRTNRKQSESTKQKIANSLKGRKKAESHKQAISNGMARYWESIPVMSDENNSTNLKSNEK
jgi:hypothetical protein